VKRGVSPSNIKMKPKDWPQVVKVTEKLLHGGGVPLRWDEPARLVQNLTGTVFLYGGPNEFVSDDLPSRAKSSGLDHLSIDELYGSYKPRTRTIEIYRKRILQDHRVFGCSPEELTHLVRLHEYAHAAIHIGVRCRAVNKVLSEVGPTKRTDWKMILRQRSKSFRRIPQGAHELLAQAIAWAVVANDSSLVAAFCGLEHRQPPEYQLLDEIKASCLSAD
jgi:hypothetical protein